MKYLDLSFPSPEENLACDEALLAGAEKHEGPEILRFWESPKDFAVAGFSDKTGETLELDRCREARLPILRRPSGGSTVLQGPGCLNYALILSLPARPECSTLERTNRYVLNRHREALQPFFAQEIRIEGISDLCLGDLKFSGNAQRRARKFVLFHGTFLVAFALKKIETFLKIPPRRPSYRHDRSHGSFLVNLGIAPGLLKEVLKKTWEAASPLTDIPYAEIARLAREKYGDPAWNFKR
ncbi:MAG: lipoate--protein ligase family protein [Candidatus Omnitrophota bacterium]